MSGARPLPKLLAVALAALLGACARETPPGVVRIESMQLRLGSSPPVPPPGATLDGAALGALGGWQSVALPDVWDLRRRARGVESWYRAEVVLPAGHRDWALHVDGSFRGVELFANGERIGALARDDPPPLGAFLWNSALLVPLPDDRDRFELALQYRTVPAEMGVLLPITAGPRAWLAARDEGALLLRRTLPDALALIGLAGGFMVLLLARYSPEPGVYWFGFSTSLWCLAMLVRTEPTGLAGWFSSVVSHAFVPLVAIGFHRILALERPLTERVLAGSVVLGSVLRAVAPPLLIPAVDISWWIATLFVGAYTLPLALRSQRQRATVGSRWVFVAGSVLMLAGLHDVGSLLVGRLLLVPYSLFVALSPTIPIATTGAIVAALTHAMQQVRALNLELEDRVEEKRQELAASYARTAELERERAIAAERERMMRDMHDGTGGQLVSALSLVEGGEYRNEDLAETLRAALADLRLTIDSLESGPPDLLALLANARARLEPRLEQHGARFAWEVADVPPPVGFGSEQSLHLLRIFQEAVTNALKHAGAKTITVRTGTAHDEGGRACAFVEIADDGRGFRSAPSSAGGGRGLRNMRRRAEEIGAACTITSSASGTTVRLLLPL